MNKKDLLNSMIVDLENGSRFMVVGDVLINSKQVIPLNTYNDNLNNKNCGYNINKVYIIITKSTNDISKGLEYELKAIWERESINWRDIKVDTPVKVTCVSGEDYSELIRHFAGTDLNGNPKFWIIGKTSYTTYETVTFDKNKYEFEILK